jgi:pyruvate/2-oxoglutarate dehydrogenase complex dihydrolipoamide acyltransferase (E2) component
MALVEVKVPDIGDFDEVAVIELLVKPGDTVKAEQSLITVESDKASMEIPSSTAGVVKELKVKLGDKVKEGSVVLVLEAEGAAVAPAAPAAAPVTAPAASAPAPAAAVASAAPAARGLRGACQAARLGWLAPHPCLPRPAPPLQATACAASSPRAPRSWRPRGPRSGSCPGRASS